MPPNIYIVGMPGVGKSTVGRLLSQQLQRTFVDLDDLVEAQTGSAPADIISREGETQFREYESTALATVAAETDLVVATGGGVVMDSSNLDIMRQTGLLILLSAPPAVLAQRLQGSAPVRPLLGGSVTVESVANLLAERAAAYAAVERKIDTTPLSADAVAQQIMEIYQDEL